MESLATQRCFNHALREAVARCPQCRHCFCRECVTEHDDRVICAACLARLARTPRQRRPALAGFMHVLQCALGVILLWFFFYLIGEGLLRLPTSFHEGALWKASWWDKE